jgi:hypothetical protein
MARKKAGGALGKIVPGIPKMSVAAVTAVKE